MTVTFPVNKCPPPAVFRSCTTVATPRLTTKQYHLRNWRGSRVGEKFTVNAPPDRQAITEGWQGKQRCQPFGDDAGCSWSLQIPIRLAPSIFMDDIGESHAAGAKAGPGGSAQSVSPGSPLAQG